MTVALKLCIVLAQMHHFYDKLINRVVSAVPLVHLKRSEAREAEGEPASRFRKPFITVSREPGSGGKPIAKLISERLGFTLYDRKIIEDVSRNVHSRKALMESIDEHGRSAIDDIIHATFNPDYVSDIRYIRSLSSVVLSTAMRGEVVILGRGANFITPFEKGLHVRVCAPYPMRVERAIKFERYTREEAIAEIRKTDAQRKEFIRHYFGKDVSNPNYYDLTINTMAMSIENAAVLVIGAFKNKFPEYARRIRIKRDRL